MLTDGKSIVIKFYHLRILGEFLCIKKVTHNMNSKEILIIFSLHPLTKRTKYYLWECEEERFVYKACLRKLLSLKRTDKHTSWDTAVVSNITLT